MIEKVNDVGLETNSLSHPSFIAFHHFDRQTTSKHDLEWHLVPVTCLNIWLSEVVSSDP